MSLLATMGALLSNVPAILVTASRLGRYCCADSNCILIRRWRICGVYASPIAASRIEGMACQEILERAASRCRGLPYPFGRKRSTYAGG